MRILLDNCVPKRPMVGLLKGHEAVLASKAGVAHLLNGRLLEAAAAGGFKLLLTVDRNMRHQQNLALLPLPLLVIDVPNNTAPFLLPLADAIRAAVLVAAEGGLTILDEHGEIRRLPAG